MPNTPPTSEPSIAPPLVIFSPLEVAGPAYTFLAAASCAGVRQPVVLALVHAISAGSKLHERGSPINPSFTPSLKSHLATTAACNARTSAGPIKPWPLLSFTTRLFHNRLMNTELKL